MSDLAATGPLGRRSSVTSGLSRLFSPFAVGVGARLAGQAISFLLVILASRFLGLEDFGVYALAWACTVIATTFVFTGFYQALLRSEAFEEELDTFFWLKLAVGCTGAVTLFVLSRFWGGWSDPTGQALTILAPLPLLVVPTAWNEAQLLRAQRARSASLYVVAAEGLALVAAWAGFVAGWGVLAIVLSRYVSTGVGLILTTALVRRRPRAELRRSGLRRSTTTAAQLWGTSAIGMFGNYGADLILAAFLSPAAVGAYRSGARIAITAADIVYQPLRMLSWSKFSRLEREGTREDMRLAWCENMRFAGAMILPFMAVIALLAPDLVVTIFDESWLPAAPVVAVLCLSRMVTVPQALMDSVLMCLGKGNLHLRLRLASGVLLLALLLLLGPFGPVAAAWALFITGAVMTLVVSYVQARELSLSFVDHVRSFAPGALLLVLCLVALQVVQLGTHGMAPLVALVCHLGAVIVTWCTVAALMLWRRILTLPTP